MRVAPELESIRPKKDGSDSLPLSICINTIRRGSMQDLGSTLIVWLIPIVVLASIVSLQIIRILREYERRVIFRLGKLLRAKGPGLITLIPIVDRMVKVDLRVIAMTVPKQEMMTRDNVPVTVDAVVYFRVTDPEAAIVKVENFLQASSLIAQTTLRSVIGQAELDELLAQREKSISASRKSSTVTQSRGR